MISQKLAIKIQSIIYIAYGVGFLFAPSLMHSIYIKQSGMHETTELALKFCGAANTLWGMSMLAITDHIDSSKAMKKCILSILAVGNIACSWLIYSNKHLYVEQALYQGILMHVAFFAMNVFCGGFIKTKSS